MPGEHAGVKNFLMSFTDSMREDGWPGSRLTGRPAPPVSVTVRSRDD
jgi:hypothetical protein